MRESKQMCLIILKQVYVSALDYDLLWHLSLKI